MARIVITAFFAALIALSGKAISQEKEQQTKRKVVALDPGHGGVDLGVRSSKSILEKSVTFKLAQSIQASSKKYPDLSVVMTRDGDLDRSWLRRVEFANSQKADLYISLHTGGGFSAKSRPIEIFIPAHSKGKPARGNWDSLNFPFKAENQRLAKMITEHLAPVLPGREIRIVSSGQLMLQGLAMPAALIEPLDLSNPQDEIMADDKERLEKIADAIMTVIEKYLSLREGATVAHE